MIRDRSLIEQFEVSISRFVRERLVPNEQRTAAEDQIPQDILAEMKALGLFGLSIPEQYGGLGFTMEEEVSVIFKFCRTSPAFRSCFGTNVGLCSQGIVMDGTPDQKQKYLPALASGELIGSFALTEPDSGSDAASLRTRAKPVKGGYVLNGTKRFITNAPQAGLFVVMARTGADGSGAGGISAFLVERSQRGIAVGSPDRKMGQQGAQVADVIMEDCFVPREALLGGREGEGFKTAMKAIDRGRLHISAVCVGVAERLIRECVKFARERKQFGRPIGDFQLIQAMIAESSTEAFAARSMVLNAAAAKDEGRDVTMEASCCKLFASEMVGRVADRAVQIFGGAGYIEDYGIERFYRDVRLFRLYEGTSQIQQLVIARETFRRLEHEGI